MPPLLTGTSRRGPRALKRMALAVAVRNIASITDLGDMSFADARPLLLHIENPHQLHALETQCPQLAAEPRQMADVWKRLLAKKVPDWTTRDYLGEMGYDEEEEDDDDDDVFSDDDDGPPRKRAARGIPWYDVYCTIKDAQDEKEAEATARLQQTLAGFTKAKETNATQLVTGWQRSRALVKKMPGVGVARQRRGPGASGGGSSSLSFAGGSRTKMTNGQSVLRRARREAREISKAAQLSTPSGRLAVQRNQIRAPPPAMLHEHRVAQQPEIVSAAAVVIRAPGRRRLSGASSVAGSSGGGGGGTAGTGLGVGNAEREARLLALKRGGTVAAAGVSSGAPTPKERPAREPAPRASPREPPREKEKRARVARELEERRASSRNPKPGRRVAADDDLFGEADDELFGEVPAKRRRLNVDDLERTASGSGSGSGSGSSSRPAKPAAALPKRPSIGKPTSSATTKPASPAPAPTLPSRPAPAAGPPRKKQVDIFMKKKKR